MSSQLVDLHCHILPGIDDGAKNLDVSMSLIQKEMEDGVVGIVFTPLNNRISSPVRVHLPSPP